MSEREPGLNAAVAPGLDPDEVVSCYAVSWLEDGRWHRLHFADSTDANHYTLTLPQGSGTYVVGTTAARRDVIPPMAPAREVRS